MIIFEKQTTNTSSWRSFRTRRNKRYRQIYSFENIGRQTETKSWKIQWSPRLDRDSHILPRVRITKFLHKNSGRRSEGCDKATVCWPDSKSCQGKFRLKLLLIKQIIINDKSLYVDCKKNVPSAHARFFGLTVLLYPLLRVKTECNKLKYIESLNMQLFVSITGLSSDNKLKYIESLNMQLFVSITGLSSDASW